MAMLNNQRVYRIQHGSIDAAKIPTLLGYLMANPLKNRTAIIVSGDIWRLAKCSVRHKPVILGGAGRMLGEFCGFFSGHIGISSRLLYPNNGWDPKINRDTVEGVHLFDWYHPQNNPPFLEESSIPAPHLAGSMLVTGEMVDIFLRGNEFPYHLWGGRCKVGFIFQHTIGGREQTASLQSNGDTMRYAISMLHILRQKTHIKEIQEVSIPTYIIPHSIRNHISSCSNSKKYDLFISIPY